MALEIASVISLAKRNGSSEADLDVFTKGLEEGLGGGEEAEAFARGEIVGEDDILEGLVVEGVDVEISGKVSA